MFKIRVIVSTIKSKLVGGIIIFLPALFIAQLSHAEQLIKLAAYHPQHDMSQVQEEFFDMYMVMGGLITPEAHDSGVIKAVVRQAEYNTQSHYTLDLYGDGLMEIKISSNQTKNSQNLEKSKSVSMNIHHGTSMLNQLVPLDASIEKPSIRVDKGKIVIY